MTIGVDGLGLISYLDATNGDLRVAHCNDVACTSAAVNTLDSLGIVGYFTSVTIGADGLGLISYYDATNSNLKVARCNDVACTSATVSTVDTGGGNDVGQYASVTIGTDGLGLISYYDGTNGDLKVAHCNNVACTSAVVSTPDAVGDVGSDTSVTIGFDGLGLISYHDGTNGDLKVAHCNDVGCTGATLSTVDTGGGDDVGQHGSITVGQDGLGLISYLDATNNNLKVAHCNDVACTSAAVNTLDSMGFTGWYTSVTIGADGLGLISYYDYANTTLKVAHCNDAACTSAASSTLDGTGFTGWYTAVTIGSDGLPLISYYDWIGIGDLKVAHCANVFCTSYFRRR
jgi:hypothetical protein